ncbi:MAG TPA: hypothetical protein VKU93_11015 [Terracidiphilus sp.]|nr:hypothetical protein [Terracidiphilus sp.]
MKRPLLAILAVAVFCRAAAAGAQKHDSGNEGQGQAVVTVIPAHGAEQAIEVAPQDIREVKVDGKSSQVTGWTPLRGSDSPIELVLLMDPSARSSLGTQLSEFAKFAEEMPPNMTMAFAYMNAGQAQLAGPLSSNPQQVLQGLHLPTGPLGAGASPYFCLSDLARNWPSHNRSARRIVVLVSDGVDYYNLRYDPEDPYVQAAIQDSVRAGLIVYALYWKNAGRIDRYGWAQDAGQNLLLEVTEATGGNSYWEGMGNPVTFQPYLRDVRIRLNNQYQLSFTAPFGDKPAIARLDVKASIPSAKIDAPQQVLVRPVGEALQ